MTETKYLKIISDLFRLTGYATGILKGIQWNDNIAEVDCLSEKTVSYLEEQQNLILMQLVDQNNETNQATASKE